MNWIKNEWWSSLSGDEQMLWTIAWVFTVLWVIRALMTWTNPEEEQPTISVYQPSFYRYSAGSLIAAMALWGWSSALTYALSHWAPVAVGLGSLLVVFLWEQWKNWTTEQRLRSQVRRQMNQPVAVKSPIPAARQGIGKITLGDEQHPIEMDALTDGPLLGSGTMVRIAEIIGSRLIRVELQ